MAKMQKGPYVYNILSQGYCISPTYMQCCMDKKLYPHKGYTHCYIDDIVIFPKTFKKHIQHLCVVLSNLVGSGMMLALTKCYISYHSIELLEHVIDRFGLSTMKQKTDRIAALSFLKTLWKLDYFLGLVRYYRFFIEWFRYKANPLNKLKMELYRDTLHKNLA